ncbi:hypothetical protein V495_06501 [Pseudogymnoascus sp. VKM F-4514 (FW-929)]|nr:hypothetical protein V495_06501 [Pseudogymnoascus sp. VKM F-4514 (FW-929)]KFY57652.1 hypothetical protein V497_05407 [Pseudogymnoascus sp. VKM F-4516 (FW-969)]
MVQPDGASPAVEDAGQPRQVRSVSQTQLKPGQQVCQNYTRGLPCYRRTSCRFFHDDEARINWRTMKQNEKKAAVLAYKASKMSNTAQPKSSNLAVPSEADTLPPQQLIGKPTVSQTASTSDTSPSMASTATTPLTDYVHPHVRNKSNSSLNSSQSSSIDSDVGQVSFNEWNQHRAEVAASFIPRVFESTTMVGQDHLDGILKQKSDMLTPNPPKGQCVKPSTTSKGTARPPIIKLPVDMPKKMYLVANGIAATAGFLPFGAGSGNKPEGITDEMWAFMRDRDMKNMSVSTMSSGSSRASRKPLKITEKVMGFIHRRVNTADLPAPFDADHPAYEGAFEKPRVCLPNFGNRQTSPKKTRSPLSQVHPSFGLGIIHETPLSNLPNTTSDVEAVLKYQSPQTVAARDNSANIKAWLEATKFIAADDMAIEEESIRAKQVTSQNRVDIISKYMPRLATAITSSYGETLLERNLLSPSTLPVASNEVVVNKPSSNLIVTQKTINPGRPSNGILQVKPNEVKISLGHQVTNELLKRGPSVTAKTGPNKAELCLNYIRGFPCYYGDECDRYHDEELRDKAMMHPCLEYNSGELCHNRKFCTLYHDMAIHDSNRMAMTALKANPMVSAPATSHMNAPRCLEFALGHECPRKGHCALYHDTVFRNATRFANDVCFNFLLGLPCHVEMCKYRHDIDLRDTLNGVRSYRSMPFMDGARSNKTETFSEGHKYPQERPSMPAPVTATIPVTTSTVGPLCFNYLFGMRCSAGPDNCKFRHDDGLRAQVGNNICRNFAMGFACIKEGGCRFYHDVKLRDMLRASNNRKVSGRDFSKVGATSNVFQGNQKGVQQDTKSANLVEKKAMIGPAPIQPPSPAKSEGASAWVDFAAHIAAEDATVVTRALTNSSGRSQASLVTVFRDRTDKIVEATASKVKDVANTTVASGNKSRSTSRFISAASCHSNISSNTRSNTKITRFCPRFHGGRYHCENGDKCDFVHDPKLQKIYKSKDPRFQNTKPPRNGAKTSQWAKNSYDCGAWSLPLVPMAPPTKAKGEFVWFPLLPSEIRLKIWEFCLALPYNPIVQQVFRNVRSAKPTAKYVCKSRLPPLLETCHESRVEALKCFSLCLGTVTSPPRTYVNEISSVYLSTRRSGYFIPMMQSLLPIDLINIRFLTLKLRDWLINDDCVFRDAIWKFTNLKELLMLISSRDEDEEFRTPVATDVLMSVLAWQADELNPGFQMPYVSIEVVDGLEIDSDPEEYAPPANRGERMLDYWHEREIHALFSSAM